MQVITNNHERQFVYRYDVPASVLANDLDWTTEEEHLGGYFCYRGTWYHVDQFMSFHGVAWIQSAYEVHSDQWDGYHGDSYFSGVLIKLSEDCETYRVGTYLC
tara:strand:+ start:176 stop:484 length:309 start_codon:yes stop_codon:yes gene_type:complete